MYLSNHEINNIFKIVALTEQIKEARANSMPEWKVLQAGGNFTYLDNPTNIGLYPPIW